jgi:hypothetical protein
MREKETSHEMLARKVATLKKVNKQKYLEWASEQLDEYWWENVFTGFGEEWVIGECKDINKLINEEKKKRERLLIHLATDESSKLIEIFEEFATGEGVYLYEVIISNKKALHLAAYIGVEEKIRSSELADKFIEFANAFYNKNIKRGNDQANDWGNKIYNLLHERQQ